jgi:hypothetical protein
MLLLEYKLMLISYFIIFRVLDELMRINNSHPARSSIEARKMRPEQHSSGLRSRQPALEHRPKYLNKTSKNRWFFLIPGLPRKIPSEPAIR